MNTTNAAATLASVVFLKIQEFARRPVQEQTRLRAQLEAVVAVTASELALESRIVLDAADGMALVVLGDAEGSLRLAERALAATAAGLPLSAGIEYGAVQAAPEGGQAGLIGDGISVAASIAEFASPSRLMVSRAFKDALAYASPRAEARLHSAGVFTDGSLRRHELFTPDPAASERKERRRILLRTVGVLGLIGAGVGARVAMDGRGKFLDDTLGSLRKSLREGERLLRNLQNRLRS